MDPRLVKRLLAINREFYIQFAHDFSGTRSAERIDVSHFMPYLHDDLNVVDAGCGNGRLAERLDHAGLALKYVGFDATTQLIEVANSRIPALRKVSAAFLILDVTAPGWSRALEAHAPFDAAFALALLHHIPGVELRRHFLRSIRTLLRPGGILLMTNWRFMQSERLRRKQVPWQTLGIDEDDVEPGDALIDWKRGGTGFRYVHEFTPEELVSLALESGFQVLDQHKAEDLNLFSVLKRGE